MVGYPPPSARVLRLLGEQCPAWPAKYFAVRDESLLCADTAAWAFCLWGSRYSCLDKELVMDQHSRMSPWTALFMGIWIVGAVAITAGTAVTLYSLRILDGKASAVLRLADTTVEGLPELIDSLPRAIGDLLNDRRAPEYADSLSVQVDFIADSRSGGLYPALTITNLGSEVVSLLGIRVAALGANEVPLQTWSDVVATPIPLDDDDWPGPLLPTQTRYVVMSRRHTIPAEMAATITGAWEISELRVWEPQGSVIQTASAGR